MITLPAIVAGIEGVREAARRGHGGALGAARRGHDGHARPRLGAHGDPGGEGARALRLDAGSVTIARRRRC